MTLVNVGTGDSADTLAPTPSNQLSTLALKDMLPPENEQLGRKPQENANIEPPLIAFVKERFQRAETHRLSNEQTWLESFKNYRGTAGTDPALLATEKSKVFIKLTKTKTLAAYGQITEIVFPTDGQLPIAVEATSVPENIAETVNIETNGDQADKIDAGGSGGATPPSPYGYPGDGNDPEPGATHSTLMQRAAKFLGSIGKTERVKEGPALSPTAITIDPAAKAAEAMTKKIHDQLEEGEIDKELRLCLIEQDIFGTGCMKGPTVMYRDLPYWDEQGNYIPTRKRMPDLRYASIWNIYPDPDAISAKELPYLVERHRYSRAKLRSLKDTPHVRNEAIEAAIAAGYNYTPKWWELSLRDSNANSTTPELFEVLEYWGTVDIKMCQDYGLAIPPDMAERREIPVNILICNNEILKLVINPFQPFRVPYMLVPYEVQLYSVWGIGVPENMRDEQRIMNGMWRLAIDNAVLSSNVCFELDQSRLMPGQNTDIYAGKIFFTNGAGQGQAMNPMEFPNTTPQILSLFDKARTLVDEGTGIPSFSHGSTSVNASIGRTSSGMSMLMGAAATSIKTVIKNIDDYLLTPLGTSMFYFNMQFDFDPMIKGDLKIRALGTESFMKNEVRSQRITTALQLAGNQVLLPFLNISYLLRELFKSMDVDPNKATNTNEDAMRYTAMLAQMQQQMQAGQQPNGGASAGPQPDTAQEQQPVAMPGEQGFSAAQSQSPPAPAGQGMS